MLFHDGAFLFLFMPVVLLVFHLLAARGWRRPAVLALIAASAVFYGVISPGFLAVFVALTLVNYAVGSYVCRTKSLPAAVLMVAGNVLFLAYFKYTNFLIDNWNAVVQPAWRLGLADIALPLAISFFTFQKISYIVDCYRGTAKVYDLGDFFLFVFFFPQLMAGPIVRHNEFMPQMADTRRRDLSADLAIGGTLFAFGLFKKVVIADTAGVYVDQVFAEQAQGGTIDLLRGWMVAFSYAMQIYFDFSGYSDMALGLARMFGLNLPLNFLSPYQSRNIVEFWRRWHMTLSRWLKDYLYIPLGGNRHGPNRRMVNLMLVMLIGGLWHGANWTFVVWGGLHGLYLVVCHAWGRVGLRLSAGLSWFLTMLAVLAAWVPFRAPTMASALDIWSAMAGLNGVLLPGRWSNALAGHAHTLAEWGIGFRAKAAADMGEVVELGFPFGGVITLGIVIAFFLPNLYEWMKLVPEDQRRAPLISLPRFLSWRPSVAFAVLTGMVFVAAQMGRVGSARFLYWQF